MMIAINNFLSKYIVWYPAFLLRGQHNIWKAMNEYGKSQYYEPDQLRAVQWEQFGRILLSAYNNIKFYRMKYKAAGVHPDDIRCRDDIRKLPVLTKKEIIANQNIIYNNNYSGKKFRRSTSGSTGIPLIFYKDSLSMAKMDAILYRNYSWMGIDIGDRQARFWGHPLNNRERFRLNFQDRVLNRLRLSPFELEEKNYRQYLKQMESFKAQYIYGYAQSVFQFSDYFYEKRKDLSYLDLKAVILTGEMVFPHQIAIIKTVFGCDVTEEYGCTEVGVMAFRCRHGNMHLMENLLIEESADISDGSGNIVVSELYGSLFPFIRYQIGDRGHINYNKECPCGRKLPVFEGIFGRQDEFIRCPGGKRVDPYIMEYLLDEMPSDCGEVSQFRIIQKSQDHIEVLFVAKGNPERIREYVGKEFSAKLSPDMKIEFHFVPFLERAATGKCRCFISEISGTLK